MRWIPSLALLVVACGRVDDSVPSTPETGGHSSMAHPVATGGTAMPQGALSSASDAFGGSASGGAMQGTGGLDATHSGGTAAADGDASANSGGTSSVVSSATAGGGTTVSTAPDTYPIIEVPMTCANYPANVCGYVSDGFGNIIYCGPCPCTVTCEQVCTSGSPNSLPSCVTEYDAANGYTLKCIRSTGCNDGHLRGCWCKRT
jgi:hypothetical protein